VAGKLNFIPDFNNTDLLVSVFILPLAVQWWSVWYPGAEPGGGGYVVQRMLSAKSEKDAMGATLLFNAAHYAVRPWPWIIVALASLVVFPDLNSLATAFPDLGQRVIGHDLAYPAMLTFLPAGLLGLVVASLIAAYMSTISTHLNWGSSYVVNDFYQRFVNPDATEKQQVAVGRISTLILMILAGALAPWLENAKNAFDLILQVGAGTGLLFILRWFWWRINAWTEITAMVVSFLVAVYFTFIHESLGFEQLAQWQRLTSGVGITTMAWMLVALFTQPAKDETLLEFYRTVQPGGPGWESLKQRARKAGESLGEPEEKWDVPFGILCMVFGTLAIYSTLFGTGSYIYGHTGKGILFTIVAIASTAVLIKLWPKLQFK
jgi:Na+/proline symporter